MTIFDRKQAIDRQIQQAAERAGRDPADVTLIGVTKTWPLAVLLESYEAGIRHFGENRTHELAEKRPAFEAQRPEAAGDVVWHFIGHLQSRQSAAVAEYADLFHAADREKIMRRLDTQLATLNRPLDILLEVNISGEQSKEGLAADAWETNAAQLQRIAAVARALPAGSRGRVCGLMTMAPWGAPEETIRLVFRRTRFLRDALQQQLGWPLPVLSMGMTDDFEIAIEEGASHIRVGRALFGERN